MLKTPESTNLIDDNWLDRLNSLVFNPDRNEMISILHSLEIAVSPEISPLAHIDTNLGTLNLRIQNSFV